MSTCEKHTLSSHIHLRRVLVSGNKIRIDIIGVNISVYNLKDHSRMIIWKGEFIKILLNNKHFVKHFIIGGLLESL